MHALLASSAAYTFVQAAQRLAFIAGTINACVMTAEGHMLEATVIKKHMLQVSSGILTETVVGGSKSSEVAPRPRDGVVSRMFSMFSS